MDDDILLSAYTDADWASSVDDRSSIGGNFFLGDRLVSLLSKKQYLVSLKTAAEQYLVAASCYTKLLWMKQTLKDIKVVYDDPIPILCDNTSVVSISKESNDALWNHISIKYHFLREKVANQEVRLEYLPTKD